MTTGPINAAVTVPSHNGKEIKERHHREISGSFRKEWRKSLNGNEKYATVSVPPFEGGASAHEKGSKKVEKLKGSVDKGKGLLQALFWTSKKKEQMHQGIKTIQELETAILGVIYKQYSLSPLRQLSGADVDSIHATLREMGVVPVAPSTPKKVKPEVERLVAAEALRIMNDSVALWSKAHLLSGQLIFPWYGLRTVKVETDELDHRNLPVLVDKEELFNPHKTIVWIEEVQRSFNNANFLDNWRLNGSLLPRVEPAGEELSREQVNFHYANHFARVLLDDTHLFGRGAVRPINLDVALREQIAIQCALRLAYLHPNDTKVVFLYMCGSKCNRLPMLLQGASTYPLDNYDWLVRQCDWSFLPEDDVLFSEVATILKIDCTIGNVQPLFKALQPQLAQLLRSHQESPRGLTLEVKKEFKEEEYVKCLRQLTPAKIKELLAAVPYRLLLEAKGSAAAAFKERFFCLWETLHNIERSAPQTGQGAGTASAARITVSHSATQQLLTLGDSKDLKARFDDLFSAMQASPSSDDEDIKLLERQYRNFMDAASLLRHIRTCYRATQDNVDLAEAISLFIGDVLEIVYLLSEDSLSLGNTCINQNLPHLNREPFACAYKPDELPGGMLRGPRNIVVPARGAGHALPPYYVTINKPIIIKQNVGDEKPSLHRWDTLWNVWPSGELFGGGWEGALISHSDLWTGPAMEQPLSRRDKYRAIFNGAMQTQPNAAMLRVAEHNKHIHRS